ncbi:MAG: hypothetical protein LC644_00110 [Pseudonocardia sp.]|nr:hypothetical protein [Pseudonocardia sp.]
MSRGVGRSRGSCFEYGIPAVVGVPDATVRIITGESITVEGAAGRIGVH